MPYVIKDKACVEVCPVDGIYEGLNQAPPSMHSSGWMKSCEPVCPVKAIFAEDETPERWKHFIGLNRQFFAENPGVQPATKN
jgi:NAD-dependent dihydropyrimidine dehydrogenase PreA subunit